jgi:acyl transferase domain-containing protein
MNMNETTDSPIQEEIAIIGMAGRFPGANNIAEFWQNLRQGIESIRPFSEQELSDAGISAATRNDPSLCQCWRTTRRRR